MTQIELENKIKEAQDMYSNKTPIMSDIEFDTLWDELKTEYPTSQLLNTVAIDHTDGFKKHRHSIIMGSQNKANTEAEMDKFFANHKKSTGTLKLDGCLDYDTILETDKGPLKIGYIVDNKIECKVKAKDLDTNNIIYTKIKNYFINTNDYKWYKITFSNGKTLIATGNHKIYLPELNCWREVQNLKGDEIVDYVDQN